MNTKMDQFPAMNPNPVIRVGRDGTVLYPNEAAKPLLIEWGAEIREKLPSYIGDIVQRVLCQNIPEKMEIKVGKKVYLVTFQPLPEEECVNIYGFDISDQKMLEEKLRESEEKYRIVADNTFDWEFWLGPDDRFLYMSPSCERVTGYAVWEFMDNPDLLQEIIHSDDRQSFLQHKHDTPLSSHGDIEFRIITKDGEIRWIHHLCQPIYDGKGCYAGNRGSNRDITERKRAEEALRESKARIESIFRSSPVGIGVVVDRMITEANERLCEMTGYSREELLAKSALMLYPTAEEYEHAGWVKYGMIAEHGMGYVETRWQRKDGSVVDILLSSSPIVSGDLSGEIMFTALDITERKRVEEALRLSNIYNRSLVEASLDPLVTIGHDGKITDVNGATEEVTGYSRNELIGTDFSDYFTEPEKANSGYQKVFTDGKVRNYPLEIRHKDGNITPVLYNASVYRDENGEVIGVFAAARDITERKQMEEQTRQRAEEIETVMEVAPVAIFIGHDPKCQNITGNLMANELFEAKLGENVSANVSHLRRLFHKGIELTANELPMQKAAFKDIDVRNEEIDVLLPSGEWRGLFGSASPLHDADGNVRGSVGTFIDITERKKAEAKLEETLDNLENLVKERTANLQKAYKSLKKSEKSLAEAQEMARLGNWEWDIVTNRVYWSDEIYRIFGRSPQEFDATYEGFLCYVHPDDQENASNAVKEALNGKPYSIEYRLILANGEERIVHSQGEAILDEKNNPVRMRGFTQDITERKKVEEKLRRAEEKYRIVAEQTGQLLYDYDLEKGVLDWAGDIEEVTGFTPNEFRGSNLNGWVCNIHPEDRKKIQENIGMLLRRGGTYRSEYRFRKKNGEYVYFEDSGICLKDKKGDINRILGVVKDVTERKQTEEIMAKIEIVRKQELHHRIKNNLQVISSLLDLQADKFKGRKNIRDSEVLNAFKESMDRVISIALIHEELYKGKNTDVLNFSQYIKELVDNLLLTYRLEADVSLNFDLEENFFLEMDTAIPLGITINELVTNSFKYAFSGRDKGEIRIKLHKEGNGENKSEEFASNAYVLSVSDNGVGIPEDLNIEDLDSLGLQLVTSLVDQLDGEFELKRNNGTEFTIRFTVPYKDNRASAPQ